MTEQLTAEDVKALRATGRHAEIVAAKNAGQLDNYLGVNNAPNTSEQLTGAEVHALSKAGRHSEIVKAKSEGRLDTYLSSTN